MKLTKNMGFVLLGIWLVLIGLSGFVPLGDLRRVLDILAIAAGALILLSR